MEDDGGALNRERFTDKPGIKVCSGKL